MSTLRSSIQALAEEFTDGLLAVIRGASIEELTGGSSIAATPRVSRASSNDDEPKKRKPGRLPRRSEEDIAALVDQIVACVADHPEGIRAEDLRAELKLDKKELPKPIMAALESGKIRKQGEKRATTYFAGKPARKAAPKAKAAAPKKTKKKAVKAKAAPKKVERKPKKTKRAPADKTANGLATISEESPESAEA